MPTRQDGVENRYEAYCRSAMQAKFEVMIPFGSSVFRRAMNNLLIISLRNMLTVSSDVRTLPSFSAEEVLKH